MMQEDFAMLGQPCAHPGCGLNTQFLVKRRYTGTQAYCWGHFAEAMGPAALADLLEFARRRELVS